MAGKLKILQLSPRFPFPLDDGGKIGIANILIQFAKQGSEVTFFSFTDKNTRREYISELEKYAKSFLVKHSIENTVPRIIRSFFTKEPLFIFKYKSTKIFKQLEKLIRDVEFDIIHADHSSMASLGLIIKKLTGKPLGIRLHNIEWKIWQRYADSLEKNSLKGRLIQRQADLLKEFERKLFPEADVCFAITENERESALELSPDAKIVVASAGVDPEEWEPDFKTERNRHELIIATTYHWIHNVEGIRWFIERVLPLVRKEIPDAKLILIGKEAPGWLAGNSDSGVSLVGYVPKVQPYLNKANIYISPLFVGAGIRIKILEAMAMELPVVATSLAAEGIVGSRNDGLFICDDELSFAKQIIELCNVYDFCRTSGRSARKFVISNFSWEKNVGIMIDEYKKITDKL